MCQDNVSQSFRICKVCGNEYPLTEEYFRRYGGNKKGFRWQCRACTLKADAAYRDINREKLNARQRERNKTPEFREKHAADMRVWRKEKAELAREIDRRSKKKRRENDPDSKNKATRDWYYRNHDKRRKYANEWRDNNRTKVKAYEHKRRSQKKTSLIEEITPDDIERLFKQSKGKCWWCGKKVKRNNFHLDHRIPLSRGGGHTLGNLVVSCVKCNTSKSDKMPHEWSDRLL